MSGSLVRDISRVVRVLKVDVTKVAVVCQAEESALCCAFCLRSGLDQTAPVKGRRRRQVMFHIRPSKDATLLPALSIENTRESAGLMPAGVAMFCAAATLEVMHPQLTRVEELNHLDRLLAGTDSRPLLLFKHSYSCGVSAEALDELLLHLDRGNAAIDYALITVQTHRDVSNAASRKLGVRHQTPQALLVHEGRVVWSASHFRVTAAAVEEAIRTVVTA